MEQEAITIIQAVRGNWSFELEKTFRLEGEKKHLVW